MQIRRPIIVLFLAVFSFSQTAPVTPDDIEKRVDSILAQMTLQEKIEYLGGVNDYYIRAIPRLKLPTFKMADGPLGVRNYGPSTALAGGIALAATWDPDLVRRAGGVVGQDARARGVHFLLGPGVNIYRAPMNGRNFEYFGEDPFLAAQTAAAYIEGVQSQAVCATIKHFVGNNSEYDRHNVDAIIDERTLREIYLPTFEAAVKQAHVCAIMDSYNLTNDEHMTQNGHLNNEIVKKEWGFDGIIMSDWDSTYDGVATVNNGLDLEMPSGKYMNAATLLPAIQDGRVSQATIDDHVRRILRKAIEFGWLDRDQTDLSISRYNLEGRAVALEAARSSIVLLKNTDNLLPLDASKIKTLAIIGPDAHPAQPVGGGSARVVPFSAVSELEGIANYLYGTVRVTYDSGIPTLADMADHTFFSTEITGGKPGLTAEYFESLDLSGSPYLTAVEEHVNYGPEHALGATFHSARWTGYYLVQQPGRYHVFVHGLGEEGGSRLFLDDKLIVDDWSQSTARVEDSVLELAAGPHKIRLEAYRKEDWSGPGLRLGIVATNAIVNPEATALAAKADAVVVSVGFDWSSETEGSDRSFGLPPGQDELIQTIAAANKNTIVVLTSGGAVDMNAWLDHVPALLESWYPGQEGGAALAQLLFGEYSPSGKLPVSFERHFEDNAVSHSYYPNDGDKRVKYTEGVFLGYHRYDKTGIKPLFPFGFGLSYTTFQYSDLSISPETFDGNTPVTVSFDVTNTGKRDGAEIAELYVSDTHAGLPRPPKELKGFHKINLRPGQTRKVTLALDRRAFSYYDVNHKQWQADAGDFGILVGGSSDNISLNGTVHLTR
jgi:beta-glucosidase